METLSWRRELKHRVADVIQDASSESGMDGYEMEPITVEARVTAYRLIDRLPESALLPDVVPTPDGEIAFEWDYASGDFFTITTYKGMLVYAGLFGHDRKQYGQENFGAELPQTIANILGSHFSQA